jgi:hypothetical protein
MKATPLSSFSQRLLPVYISENHPKIVVFLEMFLDWMSKEKKPYWLMSNFEDLLNVDETLDEFFQEMKKIYAKDFPNEILADSKIFLKNLSHIYRTKGIEECFELIFRVCWMADVRFSYPSEKILRASNNKWIEEKFIATNSFALSELVRLPGCLIQGRSSGASAVVKNIAFIKALPGDEFPTPAIVLESQQGEFETGEAAEIASGDAEFAGRIFEINFYEDRPGYFESTESFLSTDKRFQDNYFYQDFSYVLTSTIPINEWYRFVKKLLHPAGLQVFGRYQIGLGGEDPVVSTQVEEWHHWFLEMLDWFSTGFNLSAEASIEWKKKFELGISLVKGAAIAFEREIRLGHSFENSSALKVEKRLSAGISSIRASSSVAYPPSAASERGIFFPSSSAADYSDEIALCSQGGKTLLSMDQRLDNNNFLVFHQGSLDQEIFQC